jgi:hypothetical protein
VTRNYQGAFVRQAEIGVPGRRRGRVGRPASRGKAVLGHRDTCITVAAVAMGRHLCWPQSPGAATEEEQLPNPPLKAASGSTSKSSGMGRRSSKVLRRFSHQFVLPWSV